MAIEHQSVELVCDAGQWMVVVRECGGESRRRFEVKAHAESWHAGQCIRLGLPLRPEGAPG